jgi:WD40 repeat protein
MTNRKVGGAREHTGWVCSLGYTRDGRTLVSGGRDGRVKLWDVATLANSSIASGTAE